MYIYPKSMQTNVIFRKMIQVGGHFVGYPVFYYRLRSVYYFAHF